MATINKELLVSIATLIYKHNGCQFGFITFLARLLILIKKGWLLQLKFGGVGVNIYLWAR